MRVEMAKKGILSPYKMVLNKHFPLPRHHSPVYPQHPEISSCSQSPMRHTELESLGEDQTKSASFREQANDGSRNSWKPYSQYTPDGSTEKHRD